MDNGWQCIYYSNQLYNIQIVRAALKEQDIESVVVDKRDSSYITIGDIEVFVPNQDAILAKIIIEQNGL